MTKRESAMIEEIAKSISVLAGEEIRNKFMEDSEGIESASSKEVALWVKGAISRLDNLVKPETRNEIMLRCGHDCARAHKSTIDNSRKKRQRFESLDEFLAAEEKKPGKASRIERKGNIVYHYFTPSSYGQGVRCFCGLLKGLPGDQTVSRTYCQCSKGFVEEIWQAYLGRKPKVEMTESAVSGAKECKFAVHLV
jgi:predicted hydrocarbon binding protein